MDDLCGKKLMIRLFFPAQQPNIYTWYTLKGIICSINMFRINRSSAWRLQFFHLTSICILYICIRPYIKYTKFEDDVRGRWFIHSTQCSHSTVHTERRSERERESRAHAMDVCDAHAKHKNQSMNSVEELVNEFTSYTQFQFSLPFSHIQPPFMPLLVMPNEVCDFFPFCFYFMFKFSRFSRTHANCFVFHFPRTNSTPKTIENHFCSTSIQFWRIFYLPLGTAKLFSFREPIKMLNLIISKPDFRKQQTNPLVSVLCSFIRRVISPGSSYNSLKQPYR